MSNTNTIYLIRHTEPLLQTFDERLFIGQTDIPLSKKGIQQAYDLGFEFKDVPLQNIYCSKLIRAQHTAKIIAEYHSLVPLIKENFNEINLGSWEGLRVSEVRKQYPGEYEKRGEDIINYQTPGGESFFDCSCRVLKCFFDIISKATGNILIIGHAGVNRIILCYGLGLALRNIFKIQQKYGCINIFQYENTQITVKAVNNTSIRRSINENS